MKIFSGTSDQFGYYAVGDQKYYSKFEAIQAHTKTGIHPEWYYHDAVFDSYNWTQEPTQSLPELYQKRAEQLREKYDYIVLLYSGGADSTNILDTFLNNNIHLDEIATFHQFVGNKNNTTFTDREISEVAMPRLEQVKNSHPQIKLRIIDQTKLIYDYFTNNTNIESWIYEQSMTMMPCVARTRVHEIETFYKDSILAGKNICFLWAVDKPRIFHENGRYAFRFIDILDHAAVPGSCAPVELFYWSPDLPEMMIKQAHVIKRYLENSNINSRFISETPSHLACKKIGSQRLWLSNHGLHSLIYPTWDVDTFTAGKTPSSIISPATHWFANLEKSNLARSGWEAIMQHWWKGLPDYWRNDPINIYKGIKGCLSKPYYLN